MVSLTCGWHHLPSTPPASFSTKYLRLSQDHPERGVRSTMQQRTERLSDVLVGCVHVVRLRMDAGSILVDTEAVHKALGLEGLLLVHCTSRWFVRKKKQKRVVNIFITVVHSSYCFIANRNLFLCNYLLLRRAPPTNNLQT